jgi:hypothetical protein
MVTTSYLSGHCLSAEFTNHLNRAWVLSFWVTFGRLFGPIDPEQFEAAFRRWVSSVLPALGAEIVAIDGKTGVPGGRSSSLGW